MSSKDPTFARVVRARPAGPIGSPVLTKAGTWTHPPRSGSPFGAQPDANSDPRLAREDKPTPKGRPPQCAGFTDARFHPDDLASQRLCAIDLGFNARLGLDLNYFDIPFDWEPTASHMTRDAALNRLLNPWHAKYSEVRETKTLAGIYRPTGRSEWGKRPGLFWTGSEGLGPSAVKMAMRTVYAFASDAMRGEASVDCFKHGRKTLRSRLESNGVALAIKAEACEPSSQVMEVSNAGRLRVQRTAPGANAQAPYGFIRLCDMWLLDCAIADYYFWWAWRLFFWARQYGPYAFCNLLASLCARAGLAQIVEIAGELVHEYGHHGEATQHCVSPNGTRRNGCCQFLADQTFKMSMRARVGLPLALMNDRGTADTDRRFQEDLLGSWSDDAISSCGLPGEAAEANEGLPSDLDARRAAQVTVSHGSLVVPHGAVLVSKIPDLCRNFDERGYDIVPVEF